MYIYTFIYISICKTVSSHSRIRSFRHICMHIIYVRSISPHVVSCVI